MKKLRTDELGRPSSEEALNRQRSNMVVVLDDLRSAHNVGSIFRTCDAFLIKELWLCGITPKPPHREISKTALGSTSSVEWRGSDSTTDTIRTLKKEGYRIVAIEHTDSSTQLHEMTVPNNERVALVFGSEVNGINEDVLKLCDIAIEIPMFGAKHSFNVSVCAGMVIWECWKQQHY